ncbi:hypothetical protein HAX54_047659, partial [Datura stramonium]|nr:hypothetical protein [Datura stramonium]
MRKISAASRVAASLADISGRCPVDSSSCQPWNMFRGVAIEGSLPWDSRRTVILLMAHPMKSWKLIREGPSTLSFPRLNQRTIIQLTTLHVNRVKIPETCADVEQKGWTSR